MTPTPRGLLIVIEGLDRSGKTTQCDRLLSSIQGSTSSTSSARLQKFPDRSTPTGSLINAYLTNQTQQDDHAVHLLFSANRWEARSRILADLAAGTTVVIDRYSFSGAVYSAAKGKADLGVDWAWAPEIGLPRPDLVVFLNLELEVAERRGGWGEERYENREMQKRVRLLFREVLGMVGGEGGLSVRVVDAGVSVEEVQGKVWECFEGAVAALREREARGDDMAVGLLGPLRR